MIKTNRFVAINRYKEIRLTTLESAKESIKSIKQYYKLQILKKKKLELIAKIKAEIKELILLFDKLYEFLPEHELLEGRKKPSIKDEEKNIKSKTKYKSKSDLNAESELDKLEKTLALIEEKIKKL